MRYQEELQELLSLDEAVKEPSKLIVYNDEVNTFEWVIDCFVDVCGHTPVQAEQLSHLIHFKGKATVKTGEKAALRPFKDALVDRGLSAIID